MHKKGGVERLKRNLGGRLNFLRVLKFHQRRIVVKTESAGEEHRKRIAIGIEFGYLIVKGLPGKGDLVLCTGEFSDSWAMLALALRSG